MDSTKSDARSDAANPDRSANVPPAVGRASRTPPPLWATLVATFFGAGRLKPGPGTWGSLATVILWALASSRIPVASRTSATIVAAAVVTLIAVPLAWKTFVAGLILFRVFDIWKPFPIRRLERLPEGTGIVVDDLGAGLYALAVMHLLLHFGVLTK